MEFLVEFVAGGLVLYAQLPVHGHALGGAALTHGL
jgi:hypothetical protein